MKAMAGLAGAGDFVASRFCTAMTTATGINIGNADAATLFRVGRVVASGAFGIAVLIVSEIIFRQPMIRNIDRRNGPRQFRIIVDGLHFVAGVANPDLK